MSEKLFGQALVAAIEARLAREEREREEREQRYSDCLVDPSDCFMSERANTLARIEAEDQLRILENEGLAEFDALLTLDGAKTGAVRRKTRYGWAWLLPDGAWVGDGKAATLAKKGYKIGRVVKPAWAKIAGWNGVQVYEAKLNRWTGEYREEWDGELVEEVEA